MPPGVRFLNKRNIAVTGRTVKQMMVRAVSGQVQAGPAASRDHYSDAKFHEQTVPLRRWAEISLRYVSAKKPMPLRVVAACVDFDHANTKRVFEQGTEPPPETVHQATFGGSACKKVCVPPRLPSNQRTLSGPPATMEPPSAVMRALLRNSPLHEKKMEELSKVCDVAPLHRENTMKYLTAC